MDEALNYVDKIPSFHIIKKGLSCPCGSRKDKLYDTNSSFASHTKTKFHQKWITSLNVKIENENENEKLVDTVPNEEKDMTIAIEQPTLSPAERHYLNVKKAVKKYQSNNRDACRERSKKWTDNLKTDPEKYRKYLEEKREYMNKARQKKKDAIVCREDPVISYIYVSI
jgi:hypothetical protein